jgi:very-short-patch-repair endonuclease
MLRRIDPKLTARARELRNTPPETELAVWRRISRFRPAFTRQLIVAPFIIDLACPKAPLAVEFDGSQHFDAADYDARRTRFLEERDWRVIRLWNSEVLADPTVSFCTSWKGPPSASAAPTSSPSLPGRGGKEGGTPADGKLPAGDKGNHATRYCG